MKTTTVASEDILFIMPQDRELQFPAMGALQMYVNSYELKMQANCVVSPMPEHRFRYAAIMPDEDWLAFLKLGIELKQQPEAIGFPDSVIELSDEKILSFYNSEKHAAQACAAIAGVECPPYPQVKTPALGVASHWLMCLDDFHLTDVPDAWGVSMVTEDAVLELAEGAGITTDVYIGRQSWRTYAVAAMGLPVIEILPRNRSVNWLSKFKNPLYRVIEEDHLNRLPGALSNIEQVLRYIREKQCSSQAPAVKDDETLTAVTASIAIPAASTSATPSTGLEK